MNENTKDSPYMLIPEIAAGVFATITIIIALGGIAATVFVPEGMAAFFLAIVASLLSLVAGLAVILAVAVIAIFTKSGHIRVYSIAFGSLFLVIALLINASGYSWFFFDPAKRAEYEAEKRAYDEEIGRLLDSQLDDQTNTSSTGTGYFAWRMESDWGYGYEYYYIDGSKNGMPMSISASKYEEDDWTIQIYPGVPIPDIGEDISNAYVEEWRVSEGRPECYDPYGDAWYDISSGDAYFNDAGRVRALNELIRDDDIELYMSWGTPQLTYYPADANLGGAAERRRLSQYIELMAELYPPEGTWDPSLCTPYG
jgi:hypothetical protein